MGGAVTGELDAGGSATAHRAVSLLHDRKLVLGQPGRGVYVAGQE
ncbi:hypothetical protein ACFYPX_29375 [Micromonospora zamorensis]